ncbi:MAG: rRNA maturation RNase YbeY [Pseudomonadaceae bacterium]|nr:rRNA maturation RNase YbeY [Pseudomonadaceae bacterium]
MRVARGCVVAIDVFVDSSVPGLPTPVQFEPWLRAALSAAGSNPDESGLSLCLRIVDETEARELNLAYRQRDYATNVLSFASEVEIPGCRHVGDIVVCAPVVCREAAEQGKAMAAHLAHLTVHGCLHLLGFDHQTDEEAKQMEELEVQVLAELGLPDPYQWSPRAEADAQNHEACSNG